MLRDRIRTGLIAVSLVAMFLGAGSDARAYPSKDGSCHVCHSDAELGPCLACHKNSTTSCLKCHKATDPKWLANQPSSKDVKLGRALPGYLPLNLSETPAFGPFYSIAKGFKESDHYVPADPENAVVKCIDCHVGFQQAHRGAGAIPTTANCAACKTVPNPMGDKFTLFGETRHANADGLPGKFFDQIGKGRTQAVAFMTADEEEALLPLAVGSPLRLLKADQKTKVTRNQRIAECSVCHNYAIQYPVLANNAAKGKAPPPEVGCPACHDAHIPAPAAGQEAVVDSTVEVTAVAGSGTSYTVTAVAPTTGRSIVNVNNRAFKIDETGAQKVSGGTWARGSDIGRPKAVSAQGNGTLGDTLEASTLVAVANHLNFPGGQFTSTVKPGDTIFISGSASVDVTLPVEATLSGEVTTLQATLDKAGFLVETVVDDENLVIEPMSDEDAVDQLLVDEIGVVASTSITYTKSAGGTGSLTAYVPFRGSFDFEIRDMRTSTEGLCMSCHTKGAHRFSVWGKKVDGTLVDMSETHNSNIGTQYRNSGHGRGGGGEDAEYLAFDEFSAFYYGSHQSIYPFDMSLKGVSSPPVAGDRANKGNTTFLFSATDLTYAYLSKVENATLPVLRNNYTCNQCHHGLAAVDYLNDRQGTEQASVLWGDASVTCLTCHLAHEEGGGENVRRPVKLSYSSRFADAVTNPRGGLNKFLDGTDIPAGAGTSTVCIFCHQGRESGLTVYLNILRSKGKDLYTIDQATEIDPVKGVSTINPHYLDAAAQLWSRNAWEFILDGGTNPQSYSSGILQHQLENCTGCHMGEANEDDTEGGHTWKAGVETCRDCHGPSLAAVEDIPAGVNYDGNPATVTTVEKIGTIAADGSTGSGLVWLLSQELDAQGIVFNPGAHPYMYDKDTGGSYTAYTPAQLQAAFNLLWASKAGTAIYYHNAFYVAQILQDSIVALGGTLPAGAVRPAGDRPATDYRTIVVNP